MGNLFSSSYHIGRNKFRYKKRKIYGYEWILYIDVKFKNDFYYETDITNPNSYTETQTFDILPYRISKNDKYEYVLENISEEYYVFLDSDKTILFYIQMNEFIKGKYSDYLYKNYKNKFNNKEIKNIKNMCC